MDLAEKERATLVTLQEEGSLSLGGRPARIVPVWRWLLEPDVESPPVRTERRER